MRSLTEEAAPPGPSPIRRALVITGLTGVAIGQPLLSILGDDPAILAYHGVRGPELLLVAAAIALGPAAALAVPVGLLARWRPRAGRVAHLVTVAALAGLAAVQVAKSTGIGSSAALGAIGAGTGAAVAAAQERWRPVSLWGAYLSALPLLAATTFVAASPASDLLAGGTDEPEGRGAGDAPSVVLLVLDELPTRSVLAADGSIDDSRFPNLAALAADGTWYRHHTSVATKTAAAVPSILTGNLPQTVPPLWTSHPDSLFTLLAPTHDLEVLETATSLCPYTTCAPEGAPSLRPGLADLVGETVDLWLERVRLGPERPPALDDFAEVPGLEAVPPPDPRDDLLGGDVSQLVRATSRRTEALVDSIDRDDGPTLWSLHLALPHQPWERWPDGSTYGAPASLGSGLPAIDRDQHRFSWSPWTAAVSEQRHLLQAEYTDRLVGQVLRRLRDEDRYESSLVVVVSDHGVSFEQETPAREVERSTVDAVAYVPLIVKAPYQRDGRVDDANLQTIDVLPTIADLLDLTPSWRPDGVAAGSRAIGARGGAKVIYDLGPFLELDDEVTFDDADAFPTVGDRWITGPRHPEDPLSGLSALLGADGLIGAPLRPDALGEQVAEVDDLDTLRSPDPDGAPPAVVTGVVPDAPPEAVVLLAVDGVVAGGSPLSADSGGRPGRFTVLLPQDVLGARNEIRLALLEGDRLVELGVTDR